MGSPNVVEFNGGDTKVVRSALYSNNVRHEIISTEPLSIYSWFTLMHQAFPYTDPTTQEQPVARMIVKEKGQPVAVLIHDPELARTVRELEYKFITGQTDEQVVAAQQADDEFNAFFGLE